MSQKILIDLSSGGWKHAGITNYFGSNVRHMYEHDKPLLAQAPNWVGYPSGDYGCLFIEGTPEQLHEFLSAFAKSYDDEGTVNAVQSLHNAIDAETPLIRAYRHVWPERYEPELPEGYTLAKFAQILTLEDQFSYGHLGSERDKFRTYCLWEVDRYVLAKDRIGIQHINGFVREWKYSDFGFEWPGLYQPADYDRERLMKGIELIAGRYQEKLDWFAQHTANDPRYHPVG